MGTCPLQALVHKFPDFLRKGCFTAFSCGFPGFSEAKSRVFVELTQLC